MIDFWIHGVLAKLKLPYREQVVNRRTGARAIVAIDGIENGAAGRWIYYVDGFRSPYHINTQLLAGVRSIRFVFEKPRHRGRNE